MRGYEIRIKGRLGVELRYLLRDLAPREVAGGTLLRTARADQASLHGLFQRLRDLGLELESVQPIDAGRPDEL